MLWALIVIASAAGSAYIALRHFYGRLITPLNILLGLVLFFSFQLLPQHLAGFLELTGVVQAVTAPLIALLAALNLLILSLLKGLVRKVSAQTPGSGTLTERWLGLPSYLKLSGLFIGCSVTIFAIDRLSSFPSGYDALNYHLPLALRWIQGQTLQMPASLVRHFSLPANAELSMMVVLSSGVQKLTTWPNVLAYLLAACAIHTISLRLGFGKVPALLAAITFVSLPIVQFQAFSGYVDLYGASFFLAGAAIFLLRHELGQKSSKKRGYVSVVLLSGVAWGIALGTKPTFYVYVAVGVIVAAITLWFERKKHGLSVSWLLGLLAVGILSLSSFWLVRALITTGNPFYPIDVSMSGFTVHEGLSPEHIVPLESLQWERAFVGSKWEWLIYPWLERRTTGDYSYGTGSGLGAIWAAFVPLGIGFGLYQLVGQSSQRERRLYAILLASFVVLSLAWWFGLRRSLRFGIPLMALACCLTVPLFDILIRKQRRIFQSLFLSALLLTASLSTYIPLKTTLYRILTGNWARSQVYHYPPLIDQLPEGSVVWNFAAPQIMHFPLAGRRLTNRVIPEYLNNEGLSPNQFVRREGIEYLVETSPFNSQQLTEVNASLVFEGQAGSYEWRIWKIELDSGPEEVENQAVEN